MRRGTRARGSADAPRARAVRRYRPCRSASRSERTNAHVLLMRCSRTSLRRREKNAVPAATSTSRSTAGMSASATALKTGCVDALRDERTPIRPGSFGADPRRPDGDRRQALQSPHRAPMRAPPKQLPRRRTTQANPNRCARATSEDLSWRSGNSCRVVAPVTRRFVRRRRFYRRRDAGHEDHQGGSPFHCSARARMILRATCGSTSRRSSVQKPRSSGRNTFGRFVCATMTPINSELGS